MTTFTESFDQADSTILGPDLTWTKFPADGGGSAYLGGPDDGETYSGAFAIYGGDRTGLSPARECGCWARADVSFGSTVMWAQATIAALDITRDDGPGIWNYPEFFLGVGLDPTFLPADFDPYPSADYWEGPTGIWVELDAHWDDPGPVGSAFLIYAYNAVTNEFFQISADWTTIPTVAVGDVLRLALDTDAQTVAFSVNGTVLDTVAYDLSGMTNPITLSPYGGLGIESFWGPGTNYYVAGSDCLDDFAVHGTAPPIAGTLAATHYPAEDLTTPTAVVAISDNSAEWEEQLSESGAGSVKIQNRLPDGTPVPRPGRGDLIAFGLADGLGGSVRAWTMLVEDWERVRVGQGGMGAQQTTLSGRGHLAMAEDGLIYPTLGYDSWPVQIDMYYDWRHPEHPRTGFAAPTFVMSMDDAKIPGNWGHSIFLPWSPNFPGNPDIVWTTAGAEVDAPDGKSYFVDDITFPWTGTYAMWLGCDNRATAYLDSVVIGATAQGTSSPDTAGWFADQPVIWFRATAGVHTIAIEAENVPRSDGAPGNPAGLAANIWVPGYPSLLVWQTNTATMLSIGYPSEPPGMSPGQAVRLAVELAQSHGDLLWIDIASFSDTLDSAGEDWATPFPTISTKVLTDFLTFLREVSASYVDMRLDPSSFALLLYNHGTMNRTNNGIDFMPGDLDPAGNIEGMVIRGTHKIANTLIGVTQFGYREVDDPASVAANGRHVARADLGSHDNPFETDRVLTKALETFANPRQEISIQVDGPVGYLDYALGELVDTIDGDDGPIEERVVAIAVRQSTTGRAQTTPTVKDLYLT
jgi:hypothetical protein